MARFLTCQFCTDWGRDRLASHTVRLTGILGPVPTCTPCIGNLKDEPAATARPLRPFLVRFHGRKTGAIGVSQWHQMAIQADSAEHAIQRLYETHDHIHGTIIHAMEARDVH